MKRNISELQESDFDLAIIGGGITGACIAMDAAMRGYSVALVEKDDFGEATSSASSKLLHGGIRYLQQLHFGKVRESAIERMYFQKLAPHLTRYIPFVIPTFKGFSKGRFVLNSGMSLYELLCTGQNRIVDDPEKKVPRSHAVTKRELSECVPDLRMDDITGGIVLYECHMHNSERMTLGFLQTAAKYGAIVRNYLAVESFLGADKGRISGIRARDRIGGDVLDIRADLVINAAGPWIPSLNQNIGGNRRVDGVVTAFSKGAHIVTRSLTTGNAVALPTRNKSQAVISRGGRHIFISPWRDYSLIGTTYGPYTGKLDDIHATADDALEMLVDINQALGSQVLSSEDVLYSFAGLYPLVDDFVNQSVYQGTGGKYQIVDHAKVDGLDGLLSVFGAKYTTARRVAEKALDTIAPRFSKPHDRCRTRETRLESGNIENMQRFREDKKTLYNERLSSAIVDNLVTNYGTDIDKIIGYIDADPRLGEELAPGRLVIAAEAVHAAREEMACQLEDFVLRRTGLGTIGDPGQDVLRRCAELMAPELGWDRSVIENEVTLVRDRFTQFR